MPVTCQKSGDKYRVVEAEGGKVATNRSGTAVDGGGHETEEACKQQAQAINANRENNSPSNNPRAAKRLRNP